MEWCYGADAGYNLFAQVSAPYVFPVSSHHSPIYFHVLEQIPLLTVICWTYRQLFGVSLNRRWSLASDTVSDLYPCKPSRSVT